MRPSVCTHLSIDWHQYLITLNIKKLCHSERSEEPDYILQPRFLATLGMTQLRGF